jgi:hypothetical protein
MGPIPTTPTRIIFSPPLHQVQTVPSSWRSYTGQAGIGPALLQKAPTPQQWLADNIAARVVLATAGSKLALRLRFYRANRF